LRSYALTAYVLSPRSTCTDVRPDFYTD
jgi:hypothetical protein